MKRPGQLEPELGRPRAGPSGRTEVRGEAGLGEEAWEDEGGGRAVTLHKGAWPRPGRG